MNIRILQLCGRGAGPVRPFQVRLLQSEGGGRRVIITESPDFFRPLTPDRRFGSSYSAIAAHQSYKTAAISAIPLLVA